MTFDNKNSDSKLSASVEIAVRFSEVDSMGIVWHGHYLQYLEEARESFGQKFHLGYMDIYKKGYQIPLIDLQIQYKWRLKYEDILSVRIDYKYTEGAKVIFEYTLTDKLSGRLIATARTTQVFLDNNGSLMLIKPVFYEDWQRANGIIV